MTHTRLLPLDQRGVALPMAMLALLILSTLVIGFSVLSASEPTIANNQLRVAQARSLAEAGIEQAVWALNFGLTHPADPSAIPPTLAGATAATPYDGSQFIQVSTGGTAVGGFRVTVSKLSSLERTITGVGYVPNDTTAATRGRAHQRITVTTIAPPALPPPPAALTVRGELQVGGTSLIDSRSDPSCGPKLGTLTMGNTQIQGSAAVWGATDTVDPTDPNNITNANGGAIPSNAQDGVDYASASAIDPYLLTDTDIDGLRAYAKAHGTYLQGTSSQPTINFCSTCTLPNGSPALLPDGLVFIDTISGTDITSSTPSSDFADVTIHGNPVASSLGFFSGWLFVNGDLRIDGQFIAHGLVYAQNDIIYRGIGNGAVMGAMMSRNIRDTSSTSIDSDTSGNARVIYNCAWARNGGGLFQTWAMQPGTYKEIGD